MSNLVKKKNVNSVAATLANWRTSPICKSAFHRVREIIPSAEIRLRAYSRTTFISCCSMDIRSLPQSNFNDYCNYRLVDFWWSFRHKFKPTLVSHFTFYVN